jgi:hypothetical protein
MTTTPSQPNIDARVEQYVKLRDTIKKLDDEHKKKMAPYREALEKLNGLLLDHLRTVNIDSAKTSAGTVYRSEKATASLEDGDAFMRFVIGDQAFHMLDRKANVTAVQDYVKEHGVLPPGVKLTTVQAVNVRRA